MLWSIYIELDNFKDAKDSYQEAFLIYKKLHEKLPRVYEFYLKTTQSIIENLSSKVKRVQD